jgi:hypothetical protein
MEKNDGEEKGEKKKDEKEMLTQHNGLKSTTCSLVETQRRFGEMYIFSAEG